MASNPFTYGNPISEPARFFGREREVGQVFSRLRNDEFESSSLVGDRRIGKTSLLTTSVIRRYEPSMVWRVGIMLSSTRTCKWWTTPPRPPVFGSACCAILSGTVRTPPLRSSSAYGDGGAA